MTDEEIIEYVVKGKEDSNENETADLATVENEGIELIGILEEVSERETQKSSQELTYRLSWSLGQLSMKKWFEDKDALGFLQLREPIEILSTLRQSKRSSH